MHETKKKCLPFTRTVRLEQVQKYRMSASPLAHGASKEPDIVVFFNKPSMNSRLSECPSFATSTTSQSNTSTHSSRNIGSLSIATHRSTSLSSYVDAVRPSESATLPKLLEARWCSVDEKLRLRPRSISEGSILTDRCWSPLMVDDSAVIIFLILSDKCWWTCTSFSVWVDATPAQQSAVTFPVRAKARC